MSKKIVETPLRFEVKDNRITLDETNSITEVMENNFYDVKIHTNEILDGCELVMKRYGDKVITNGDITTTELIKISENLNFETIRLVIVTIDQKNYWGILQLNEDLNEADYITKYKAELYQYKIIETQNEIPGLNKKSEITTEVIGEIFGDFILETNATDYKFNPSKLFIGQQSIELTDDITIIVEKDLSLIPEPPSIDGKLVAPNKITFSKDLEILNEATNEIESFHLNFNNFELNFSSYDETNGYYYYSGQVEEFTDKVPIEEEQVIKTIISSNLFVSNVKIPNTLNLYKSISGVLGLNLKFSENDFSIFEIQITGNISFKIDGQVPKTDENGNFCYKIPKKDFEIVDIYKIETDGTGLPLQEEVDEELYEIVGSKPILNQNGLKIPVYETKEDGSLDLIDGYAQRKTGEKVTINKIKYETDSNGAPVYEYLLIPKYLRDKQGNLILDDGRVTYLYKEDGTIDYEVDINGNYIYEKRRKPVYDYDDNGQVKKTENGDLLTLYETDGTGQPIVDDNGNYIFTDEVERQAIKNWSSLYNENGEIIYEEEEYTSNLLPKYEKEEIYGIEYFKFEEVSENIKLIPLKDENGQNVYETDENGNIITILDSKQITVDGIISEETTISSFVDEANINYNGFSYIQTNVDKTNFITTEVEENNIYSTTIKAEYIQKMGLKFFLGLIRYDDEDKIDYATDAVEIGISRSIETITWEPDETYNGQKYVVAKYDAETNLFYETSSPETDKQYLSGRENYLFINIDVLNNKTAENLIYKWNPEEGFYPVIEVTNRLQII